jgi:hypothetical protein
MPVTTRTTGIVTKALKQKFRKQYQRSIQQILYQKERQLY